MHSELRPLTACAKVFKWIVKARSGWVSGQVPRAGAAGPIALLASFVLALAATPAAAVPSFAQQTGQPCEACHVSAFGPQLKPFGRDFKLYGYQTADGKSKELPIAVMMQASMTHTQADQSSPPAPHFGVNDNFAVDQLSIFYAGKLPQGWGAFGQITYSGVDRAFSLDNVDVRHVREASILGRDSIIGIDFNNNPTVQDVWNSTPAWGFRYSSSNLAPGAAAATLIDDGLGQKVVGGGAYVLWGDNLYLEATAYLPLERRFAGRLGAGTNGSSDRLSGVIPYWRAWIMNEIGINQTWELGAFGIRADRFPGRDVTRGTDTINDWAVDGNYQYIAKDHVVSSHAIWLHEDSDLKASSVLLGTRAKDHLDTARADLSYSFKNTWTPSIQAFKTSGKPNSALYPNGPNSSGYVLELAYVPWGKPNSPLSWANARMGLQYVGYTEFNGVKAHADNNNTVYASLWIALAPFGGRVHR